MAVVTLPSPPQDADDHVDAAIKAGAVTPTKLAAGDAAAKQGLRDAIGASAQLTAGTGINITDDPDGRKRVAATNPRARAGGDLATDEKFAQAALDQVHEWSLEAIRKTDPHVIVRLVYDDSAQEYRGTFPLSADGSETARLRYVRVGTRGNTDAGKFLVTTYPVNTSRTLANLFDNGAVDTLIVQVGPTAERAATAGSVHAFKNGSRFSSLDITNTGFTHHVNGMSYNRTGNKLAITQGGYREPIKVYELRQPRNGRAKPRSGDQRHDLGRQIGHWRFFGRLVYGVARRRFVGD